MIRQLRSTLDTFKSLTFHAGLNVLIADKSRGASDRQSRNGAGKTSFVELVHFLFGADVPPKSIFRCAALAESSFEVVADVGSTTVSVVRAGKRAGRIEVGGNIDGWPVESTPDLLTGRHDIANETWKNTLALLWFGLADPDGERFQPSLRSLFSFFARRQESGGFQHPVQHAVMQQPWDRQATIGYLLGLDWKIPGRFQELRVREKDARGLRRSARSGELGRYVGRVADLRTSLTIAEARARRLRNQLDRFQVVPEYRELEREADGISAQINTLNVENVVDQELVRELRTSLEVEDAPESPDLIRIYEEAGIVLPGLPRRRLEEVEQFHRAVIENRRSHLSSEIESAEGRIADRDRRRSELDRRRQQVMELLKSGGALEHFTDLREELGRVEAQSENLRQRLETAERLESTKTELDVERARLTQVLRDDIRERRAVVSQAILGFEELSESLYERAGSLTIAETPNGPNFEVHIDAERSKGITNMQIFCFDLMLMEICVRHGRSPGFLIHDSHLFDGVDERQIAKALEIGAKRAESLGFQYIVTLNSDAVPTEGFSNGFDLTKHFLGTKLTDATETGGLFGIRFN